jgi:hypothetical protein
MADPEIRAKRKITKHRVSPPPPEELPPPFAAYQKLLQAEVEACEDRLLAQRQIFK